MTLDPIRSGGSGLSRVTADTSAEEIAKHLERDGAVIVTHMSDAAHMDQIADELEPYFHEAKRSAGPFWGYDTKRIGSLIRRSAGCRNLVLNSTVLEIAERVLLPFCDRIQINESQAIRIEPGEKQQVPHSDDVVYPIKQVGLRCIVNTMWAYDDFTEENGATLVVPGSHNWESFRLPQPHELVPAVMPRGSVLIYLGAVRHCGGANKSRSPRTGLVLGYSLGWLRQMENQYLAAPPEVAVNYPEQLQRLLGYAIHRPNLGNFEGQDSIYALRSSVNDGVPAYRDYLPEGFGEMLEQFRRSQDFH